MSTDVQLSPLLSFPPKNSSLGCVLELKIPPHPSPPLHVFPNWKDYYQAKKTPFSLPSSPLPLLSGSLEHTINPLAFLID
ncbi:hypothetical protein Hanom_Chr12g01072031 [Helianthus anomalus]